MSQEPRPISWPAIHGGLFLGILALLAVCLPTLAWPWYLLLPWGVYGGIVGVVPKLRRTFPRFRCGDMWAAHIAVAFALSALTSGVLLSYQALVLPDVTELAKQLPVEVLGSVFLAGVYFSIVNAVVEEMVYRGILYEAVAAEWNSVVAIGVTAVCFGLGHIHGYPPGLLGAFLACLYGLALGILRWWSKGLGLAIGCHVCADATIFYILSSAGADPPSNA